MFSSKGRKLFVVVFLVLALVMVTGIAYAHGSHRSTSDVFWFWDHAGTTPVGSSMLVRTGSGVSGTFHSYLGNDTADADGLAVTVWVVVFNEPDNCVDGCGEDDLFRAAVKPDALFGNGTITTGREVASIAIHRNAGDSSGSIAALAGFPLDGDGEPFGLIDPFGAEIHLVLRSHGPVIPMNMPDQINSFIGGCTFNFLAPTGEGDLHLGDGECQDLQFTIHQ